MRGATMDNPSCEWVRGRLPLYAGADDLGDRERRAIARHLARCPGCRRDRAGLGSAMGALAAVAATTPEDGNEAGLSLSLWPALERRIAAREAGPTGSAAAIVTAWSGLDDDRPMHAAWVQDTLREAIEAVGWREPADRSFPPLPSAVRRVALASLAASILMLSVVLPVAWQWRVAAEARELALAEPVSPLVGFFVHDPIEADSSTGEIGDDERIAELDPVAAAEDLLDQQSAPEPSSSRGRPEDRSVIEDARGRLEVDAHQIARAESIRPPAVIAPAKTSETKPRGGPAHFGFDPVELGTPMPPDGRDSRPIY